MSEPALDSSQTSSPSPTVGLRLVRWLRMHPPENPTHRRAQEAFAIMYLCSASFALLQSMMIVFKEGADTLPNIGRVSANLFLAGCLTLSLFGFLRRGRVLTAARLTSVALLSYVTAYGLLFGLRGSPTPFAMTFGAVAALALVESRRMLALWGGAFGVVLTFALLITPPYVFQPPRLTQLTSVLWTYMVFVLFLSEFRRAISQAVDSLSQQTRILEDTNADLHRTIAERDRLSAQLANSQRLEAMGRMAGSIAHDFNNLLTVIRGYTDLIANDTPKSSTHRTEVELLTQAVTRASGVTRQVLDFASPHAIALVPLDLGQFVRDLTPGLQRLVPSNVTLDVDTPPTACPVRADRAQLERLLLNLATNACDVTPPGGRIVVQVSASEHVVTCRVIDSGTGVPVELRDRIFEPFFTTKGTTGGTGLGLASAYAIARHHEGMISVADAPGAGAAFTLELPRASVEELYSAQTPNTSSATRRALDGVSVMLVEDDPAVRRLATRLLHRSGAEVTAFDNGADAVIHLHDEVARDRPIDLIVTDLRLPRGSGAEVIAVARRASPATALVAISGFLEDPAVAERAARGELCFLSKPFSEGQLLDAIDDARRGVAR